MDLLTVLTALGSLVGLVGGICGILSLINQRKRTKLMQQQVEGVRSVDAEYARWAAKFDEAVAALARIYPGYVITGPSRQTSAVGLVFRNRETLERIERYLGKSKWWTRKFQPTILTKEHLLNPVVQQVIEEVVAAVEQFKREHTDWARSLGLLA